LLERQDVVEPLDALIGPSGEPLGTEQARVAKRASVLPARGVQHRVKHTGAKHALSH
jgi:hypothetical protein